MNNSLMNYYDEFMLSELNAQQFDITNFDDLDTMLESESAYLQY
jgi:hypothetical protein